MRRRRIVCKEGLPYCKWKGGEPKNAEWYPPTRTRPGVMKCPECLGPVAIWHYEDITDKASVSFTDPSVTP